MCEKKANLSNLMNTSKQLSMLNASKFFRLNAKRSHMPMQRMCILFYICLNNFHLKKKILR